MDLLKKATELYEKGLAVTPTAANKAAYLTGWQTMVGDNRLKPNGEFTDSKTRGCGLILGAPYGDGHTAFLDVDCYHKGVSKQICQYIMDKLGGSYPYRVGQSPKFGVPVLTDKPMKKRVSAQYGKTKIEFLAQGQQVVVYGEHPEGKKGQYQWYNGEFNGEDIPRLSADDLDDIIDEFERLCEQAGLQRTDDGRKGSGEDLDDLDLAIANQPLDLTDDEVKDYLRQYHPEDLDYDAWLNVGAALHHQYRGSEQGLKRWIQWSKQSSKHNKSQMPKKYQSFGEYTGRPVTMATIIKLAKGADRPEIGSVDGPILHPDTGSVLDVGQHIEWIVEGVMERGTIGQIFAPSGVGKSFLALDLAACITAGQPWGYQGVHRTLTGKVVYLAGEGEAGIQRRKAAIELEHGIPTDNIIVSRMPRFGSKKDVERLMKELGQVEDLIMLIIDTYARATIGLDESGSGDTSLVVDIFGRIARKFDIAVCAIHHTGHGDQTRSRGSSALTAACDFEIRLKDVGGAVMVENSKAKDMPEFTPMCFRLVQRELPENFTDNFGNVITSAFVRWIDPDEAPNNRARLSPPQQDVLNAFDLVWAVESMRMTTPDTIVTEYGLDAPAQGVAVDAVRDHWMSIRADALADVQNPRTPWKRARDGAVEKGYVKIYDGIMVLV